VTSYQSYNFLHGGRDAGIIYLNKKKKKKKKKKKGNEMFYFNNQIISDDYSKTPFLGAICCSL